MSDSETFSITNTTKGKPPCLPFKEIKKAVLGQTYQLSLVIIGDKRSQNLNKKYRGKDKRANVLSFPLSNKEGEMFINLNEAGRDASKFGKSKTAFVGFLFIHGMLHLKGYRHGSKMELLEEKFRRKFKI